MPTLSCTVNGQAQRLDVPDDMLLVDLLRGPLKLTGTHVGCDTSQCGACVVHVDGLSVKACAMLAAEVDGADVLTIEGVSAPGEPLHPVQAAFKANHGLQCGFCTPGMVMATLSLLANDPDPSDEAIKQGLKGNLCRCTGYRSIMAAVREAGEAMRPDPTGKVDKAGMADHANNASQGQA
ncbi:MAG: (2Fe-2S)-binding protein [Pseudomonadota bacterium]